MGVLLWAPTNIALMWPSSSYNYSNIYWHFQLSFYKFSKGDSGEIQLYSCTWMWMEFYWLITSFKALNIDKYKFTHYINLYYGVISCLHIVKNDCFFPTWCLIENLKHWRCLVMYKETSSSSRNPMMWPSSDGPTGKILTITLPPFYLFTEDTEGV